MTKNISSPQSFLYVTVTVIINAIIAKINKWAKKSLSCAGRLQLLRSVLLSIQVHWILHFILPKTVCLHIEKLLRNFLWT